MNVILGKNKQTFPITDVQDPRSRDVNGRPLPGPREISNAVHQRSTNRHVMDLSQFTMEFGQFVSHDIQFNALAKGTIVTYFKTLAVTKLKIHLFFFSLSLKNFKR